MPSRDDGKSSLFSGLFSVFQRLTQETRSTFNMRSTTMVIKINGTEHALNTTDLNESLRQIASQAGIPLDQIVDLIHSSGTLQSTQQSAQSNSWELIHRPITMSFCTKCHRKVPESARCLYCGEILQSTVGSKETANEVDKKFLQTDVSEGNKAKDQEKQQIRDTFEDRLKNL